MLYQPVRQSIQPFCWLPHLSFAASATTYSVAHRLIGIHRSNRRCRWLLTAYSNVLACLNVGVFALTRPGPPLLPTCSWLCLSTCFDLYRGGAAVGCRRLRVRFPARTRLCNDPGQVVHTRAILFTKQYKLLPVKGQWRRAAGKVIAGLAESTYIASFCGHSPWK